jgi:hypothetical protein
MMAAAAGWRRTLGGSFMRNWLVVGVVVGVVGTFMGGCSSAVSAGNVDTYCQEKAQAECPPVVSLCSEVSESACESARNAQCQTDAVSAQTGDLRSFNANNVANCLTAIQGAFSTLDPNSLSDLTWTKLNGNGGTLAPSPGSPNDACAQVFSGNVAPNGNCTTSYDCANGNVCGATGTCGAEADKQAGDGCADPGELCTNNTVCTQQGRSSLCTSGAPVGAKCDDLTPCSVASECKAGKCVQLSAVGGPCVTNADCDPTNNSFCDTSLAHPSCETSYQFGRGLVDCKAFGG